MKIWRVKITLLAIVEGFHSRSFFSSSFQFLLDTRGRLIYAFFPSTVWKRNAQRMKNEVKPINGKLVFRH